VAVLLDGVLQQCDTPRALYDTPANVFVAGFIGSPAMNLLRGVADDDGVLLGDQRLPLRTAHRGDVIVGIRPEAMEPGDGLALKVVLTEMLGSDVLLHCEAPTSSVLTGDMLDTGDDLVENTTRFIARVPPSLRPEIGSTVSLRVDLDRVHLFDPATERVISRG
jgi:multiple sugar transport system ATP-binding protein